MIKPQIGSEPTHPSSVLRWSTRQAFPAEGGRILVGPKHRARQIPEGVRSSQRAAWDALNCADTKSWSRSAPSRLREGRDVATIQELEQRRLRRPPIPAGGLINNNRVLGGVHIRRSRSTPVGPAETVAVPYRSGSIDRLEYRDPRHGHRGLDVGRSLRHHDSSTAAQPVPEEEDTRLDSTCRHGHSHPNRGRTEAA